MIPSKGDIVYFRGHPNKGGWKVVSVEQFRAGLVQAESKLETAYFYAPLTDLAKEEWAENARKLPEDINDAAGLPPKEADIPPDGKYETKGDDDGTVEKEQSVADPAASDSPAGGKPTTGKR